MENSEIKSIAKANLKPQFWTAVVASLITFALSRAAVFIPAVGGIAVLLIAGPLQAGNTAIFMSISRGEKSSTNQLFEPFSRDFTGAFVTNLFMTIYLCLWSLLFVIPGIVKGYSYSMSYYLFNKEGISGNDAIRRSMELMKGHRMDLFMLHLSFIPWLLLTVITCGIAYIWVGPYMTAASTVFFDCIYDNAVKSC